MKEYKELTYEESLKILNITENYTEEELKKNYRKYLKKMHPDVSVGKSKEEQEEMEYKSKQVIEAYTKLLKKLKGEYVYFPNSSVNTNKKSNNTSNNINIGEYKKQILKKISFYIKDIENINPIIPNFKDERIELLKYSTLIALFYNKKEGIDNEYKKFKNRVIKINKLIKEKLFEENKIDENKLNITINYDQPVKKFYDEMEEISEKYGKKSKLKKQLEQEALSYEYYTYYTDIKDIINRLIEKALKKASIREFKNLDDIIVEFNTQILEEFDKCARVMIQINEKINNGNLDNDRLKELKDVKENYSKYGYTKSIEIINRPVVIHKTSTSQIKKTILIKKNIDAQCPDFILKTEIDDKIKYYFLYGESYCCQIEENSYNTELIKNNYITLKEFMEHSIYIGKIGYKEYLGTNKIELLYVNKNILLTRIKGDEEILLDNINNYIITEERIEFKTYTELENELFSMFEKEKTHKKTKKN